MCFRPWVRPSSEVHRIGLCVPTVSFSGSSHSSQEMRRAFLALPSSLWSRRDAPLLCSPRSVRNLLSRKANNGSHTIIMASHPDSKIDCSKVYVKKSTFSNEQTGDFDGAFAAVPIKKGELVEKGLMRRLPDGFDGNTCPYIFTWSTERPNKVWGMGSGCAPFYNTNKEGAANTRMERFYDEDRFEIYAVRDIEANEELTHTYVSLKWRTCFGELNKIVHADES